VAHVQLASTEMSLRINVKKTAAMSLKTSDLPEISIYDEQVPIVKSFKFVCLLVCCLTAHQHYLGH